LILKLAEIDGDSTISEYEAADGGEEGAADDILGPEKTAYSVAFSGF